MPIYVTKPKEILVLKHKTRYKFKCKSCGKMTEKTRSCKWNRRDKNNALKMLCKQCCVKYTTLMLYGVENAMQNKEIRAKAENTNLRKYGVKHPAQNKDIQRKSEETKKKLYNDPYYNNQEKCEQTNLRRYGVKSTLLLPEVQEKIKQTNIALYGAENVLKLSKFQDKARKTKFDLYRDENYNNRDKAIQTMIDRHGVPYSGLSKELYEKTKATKKRLYGDEHYRNPEKCEQTNLAKYGVENYSQTKEAQKTRHCRYLYNGERFDSSWELALWIYAKDHGEDIERVEDPFEYTVDGKTHYYFPDFKYKSELVEIKGSQFMNNGIMVNPYDPSQDKIFAAKQQCAIDHGVKFMYQEDMMPYINYCRMKFAYKTWYHMYTVQYMWLQWLYNYSFMYDFTPFSNNVFEREGMEFIDCECSYE